MATQGATGQHSRALATTSHPGVYRRGSRWVAVYREDGRQRKQSASTFREAREIKIRRTAEAASRRAGRTLHSYALESVDTTPAVAPTMSSTTARAASIAGC
jgi:hypothetical protein